MFAPMRPRHAFDGRVERIHLEVGVSLGNASVGVAKRTRRDEETAPPATSAAMSGLG